jgi:hypothetical protein
MDHTTRRFKSIINLLCRTTKVIACFDGPIKGCAKQNLKEVWDISDKKDEDKKRKGKGRGEREREREKQRGR